MFGLESLFAICVMGTELLKQHHNNKNTLTANHWNNQKALNEDRFNPNITHEQLMKNVDAGKYYSNDSVSAATNHTTVIDNKRYEEDLRLYGYELTEKLRKAGNYCYKNF